MNSLTALINDLSENLRYYLIDLGVLLTTLREEVGRSACVTQGFKKWDVLNQEVLELCLLSWADEQGVMLDEDFSPGRLARWYLEPVERIEIVQNGAAYLHSQLAQLTSKVELEHRFAYRVLANGKLLIGIDPRDLEEVERIELDPNDLLENEDE